MRRIDSGHNARRPSTGSTPKGRRLTLWAAVSLVGIALIPLWLHISASPNPQRATSAHHAVLIDDRSPSVAFVPPSGYGRADAIYGTPQGSGVWVVDGAQNLNLTAIYITTTGGEHHYSLGNAVADPFLLTTRAVMARSNTGSVWIGINETLIDLTPSSGQVSYIQVPTPASNKTAEQWVPESLKGVDTIVSLAQSGGNLAIAMTRASSLVEYNLSTHTFDSIPLTTNATPFAVSSFGSGLLVDAISWVHGYGKPNLGEVIQPTGQVDGISLSSSRGLVGSTEDALAIGRTDLTIVSANDTSDEQGYAVQTLADNIAPTGGSATVQPAKGSQPIYIGNTKYLLDSYSGFDEFTVRQAAFFSALVLPTATVDMAAAPQPRAVTPKTGEATSAASTLGGSNAATQMVPTVATVDGDGHVWFETPESTAVYEVTI